MKIQLRSRGSAVGLAACFALFAGAAQATCISKVTNQPVPCPGAPSPVPVAAGVGSTMVLVGPPAPVRPVQPLCRNFWTGAVRPCRVRPVPPPPLPPSLAEPSGDAPLPPPGYGPPR